MYNEESSSSSSDEENSEARRSMNRTNGSMNSSLFSQHSSEAEYAKVGGHYDVQSVHNCDVTCSRDCLNETRTFISPVAL